VVLEDSLCTMLRKEYIHHNMATDCASSRDFRNLLFDCLSSWLCLGKRGNLNNAFLQSASPQQLIQPCQHIQLYLYLTISTCVQTLELTEEEYSHSGLQFKFQIDFLQLVP
jgi:hypothetical protein